MLSKQSTKNDRLFHDSLNVLENIVVAVAKVTFNYVQVLKTRINDEAIDILDRNVQDILTATNDKLYRITITFNNHYLAVKAKAFTTYTKVLKRYVGY